MNNFINNFTNYSLPLLGWTRLPKPPITDEDKKSLGLKFDDSNTLLLKKLCDNGFKRKLDSGIIPKEKYKEYIERYNSELNTYIELNFVDYMLLVWKTLQKARELGIFLDFGRGSVSSSMVAWLIGISGYNCDPIKYGLYFSRFLSKVRAESKVIDNEIWVKVELCPDIDINLGLGRSSIISWLNEIYPNRICKIATIGTLTGKICIKDVYKTLEEVSEEEACRVSDMIERIFGVVQDIKDVYNGIKDKETGEWKIPPNLEFKEWVDKHPKTYLICLQLQNIIRQTGVHASGYLLSYDELTEHTPLCLDSEKQVMSGYIMDDVQCLKLDLLGLQTNNIIKSVIEATGENIEKMNLENDPIIYDQFQNDNLLPYGLYQISSDCAYRVCMNLKPKNIMELSHVNSIARPASLRYEKPYLDESSKTPHPLFTKALEFTNFQPLYQEQTLSMVKAIGFDEESAEKFRKTFAKKKTEEIPEWVEKIKKKIIENNLPKDAGDVLIKLAEESAFYQFNLAHSISTSFLSSLTVLLKYKYPLHFYKACLDHAEKVEDVSAIQKELVSFGIKLLPPHILKSNIEFSIEGNDLRYGLKNIRGISNKSIEKLQKFKNKYSSKWDIYMAAQESKIGSGIFQALILAGSLDDMLTESRSKTFLEWKLWNELTVKEKKYVLQLGEKYSFDLFKILRELNENVKDDKGKQIVKDSRRKTLNSHLKPHMELYKQNSKNDDLCRWLMESWLIGYAYSVTLKQIFSKFCNDLVDIREINQFLDNDKVHFAAEVIEVKKWKSKDKKTPTFRISCKDDTGQISVLMFNTARGNTIDECEENNGRLPQENDLIVVRGVKKSDCIFARNVSIQDVSIYKKISEIPKSSETSE